MKILAIDTSSQSASCALTQEGKLLGEFYENVKLTHSQTILPMVQELLKTVRVPLEQVDLFAATGGPGSFTGLRIGLAAVKGMAHALGKELELCQNYLELSSVGQVRPAQCNVELDPRIKDLPVPPVSLLTLVENCAKHGVRGDTSLVVTITARQLEMEQGTLADITVGDNGPGFSAAQIEQLNRHLPKEENEEHVGLANVMRRLQLLYGKEMAAAFTNGRDGGARIEIFLPLQKETTGEEMHETADRG